MKQVLATLIFALALAAPAAAAPGQSPKTEAHQARAAGYWLSRDMQRLVFWQARERASQVSTSPKL